MGLISWQHSSVVTQATSEEDTDRSTVSTVTCMMRDNDHQKPVIQHQQVCFWDSFYGKNFILCAMAWYGMCSMKNYENSNWYDISHEWKTPNRNWYSLFASFCYCTSISCTKFFSKPNCQCEYDLSHDRHITDLGLYCSSTIESRPFTVYSLHLCCVDTCRYWLHMPGLKEMNTPEMWIPQWKKEALKSLRSLGPPSDIPQC